MMTRIGRVVLAAGLASVAQGETALRGPVMGYVVDARVQAIRPVNGIPGASHLGAPIDVGFPVLRAVFSSAGNFGLVVAAEGDGVFLLTGLGATPLVRRIAGAIRPDRLALNAGDAAAILYAGEPRRLQIVRGLPGEPAAAPVLDLSSLSGPLTSLALDTAGREALLTTSEDGRGALLRVTLPEDGEAADLRRAEPRVVALFTAPAGIALANRDRDVLVVDGGGANQLFLVRDYPGEAAIEALASAREGIADPVGVGISADGRRIFVANAAAGGTVLVLERDTRAIEMRATPEGAPNRLERMLGRTTFLLNEPGETPLMVLDNLENPEVYFVPAGRDN